MRALLLCSLVGFVIAGCQTKLDGQELAKIRDEYFANPIRQYQPNDPWHRSILYRLQTGHYGRFYNCDGEEQKRCSPYICWKNSDCPTIPCKSCLDCVNEEIYKVKRRICDGAGPCCSVGQTVAGQTCSCAQCVANRSPQQTQPIVRSNIFQSVEPLEQNVVQTKRCDCPKCRANSERLAANQPAVNSRNSESSVLKGTVQPIRSMNVKSKPVANLNSEMRNSSNVRSANSAQQVNSNLLSRLKARSSQASQQPLRQAQLMPQEHPELRR